MMWLLRPWCWWAGHRWTVLRSIPMANTHLAHLHPLAACDADCLRCGYEWRDAANFNRRPWLDGPREVK